MTIVIAIKMTRAYGHKGVLSMWTMWSSNLNDIVIYLSKVQQYRYVMVSGI